MKAVDAIKGAVISSQDRYKKDFNAVCGFLDECKSEKHGENVFKPLSYAKDPKVFLDFDSEKGTFKGTNLGVWWHSFEFRFTQTKLPLTKDGNPDLSWIEDGDKNTLLVNMSGLNVNMDGFYAPNFTREEFTGVGVNCDKVDFLTLQQKQEQLSRQQVQSAAEARQREEDARGLHNRQLGEQLVKQRIQNQNTALVELVHGLRLLKECPYENDFSDMVQNVFIMAGNALNSALSESSVPEKQIDHRADFLKDLSALSEIDNLPQEIVLHLNGLKKYNPNAIGPNDRDLLIELGESPLVAIYAASISPKTIEQVLDNIIGNAERLLGYKVPERVIERSDSEDESTPEVVLMEEGRVKPKFATSIEEQRAKIAASGKLKTD